MAGHNLINIDVTNTSNSVLKCMQVLKLFPNIWFCSYLMCILYVLINLSVIALIHVNCYSKTVYADCIFLQIIYFCYWQSSVNNVVVNGELL